MSDLTNHDLRPVPPEERTWNWWSYAALWIGMAHNVPTWLMAGGLIDNGFTWWEALLTIALGNIIVLAVIVVNSHGGTKYGIPFPILARSSFGIWGANIPAVVRGIIAAVWFGINTYIGGGALKLLVAQFAPDILKMTKPEFLGQGPADWIFFLIFLAMNLWIVKKGMEALRKFEFWAGPAVLVVGIVLAIWAVVHAGGFGPIIDSQSRKQLPTMSLWVTSLMGVVGFWSTLSVNAPDFTRFAKSQKDQLIGQAIGLPITMVIFAFLGIMTTSATALIFGKPISDPVQLIGHLQNVPLAVLALFCIVIATLSVNVPANLVSPSYDFSNLAPKRITMWHGALIAAVIATCVAPWKLLANSQTYIFVWLGNCSLALGPVAGVLFADYWFVKKKQLDLEDLYKVDGKYRYTGGFNIPAFAAIAVALLVTYIGFLVPSLKLLSDAGWLTGFVVAAGVHVGLSKLRPQVV